MATRAHLPASATRWWLSVDDLHARHVRTTALIPPDGGLLRSSRASCYSLGSGLTPAESMPCRDELNGRTPGMVGRAAVKLCALGAAAAEQERAPQQRYAVLTVRIEGLAGLTTQLFAQLAAGYVDL